MGLSLGCYVLDKIMFSLTLCFLVLLTWLDVDQEDILVFDLEEKDEMMIVLCDLRESRCIFGEGGVDQSGRFDILPLHIFNYNLI